MDRRQRKTREVILRAFCSLLSQKNYEHITVGEIINEADVGRATFYAHFETKDYLLKELCAELFCHVFDSARDDTSHRHIFVCEPPESAFLHLFVHIKNNDNQIRELLCTQNNTIFLRYFKDSMAHLIEAHIEQLQKTDMPDIPRDFLINHISSSFIECVYWWAQHNMSETPEVIHGYFMNIMRGKIV